MLRQHGVGRFVDRPLILRLVLVSALWRLVALFATTAALSFHLCEREFECFFRILVVVVIVVVAIPALDAAFFLLFLVVMARLIEPMIAQHVVGCNEVFWVLIVS